MAYIKTKNIKIGEEYYFVDTDFKYGTIKMPIISKQKINKIIGNKYSTKNDGDRYEVERFIGFKTETEAYKYALKQLKQYKQWINKEISIPVMVLEEALTHSVCKFNN